MARDPVEDLRISEAVRPVASPVDTYAQPPAAQPATGLRDLAQGLAKFDPALRGLLDEATQKKNEEDALRAEADFHKINQVGYEEGVRQGLIPANESRAYMRAYKGAQGTVAGYDIEQKFQAAYDAWGDKTSEDPQAFNTFLAGFMKENVTTADPDVLRGLQPRLRALANNAQARNVQDRSNATKAASERAHAAEAGIAVDQERDQARAGKRDTDYSKVFEGIVGIRQKFIDGGGKAEEIDNKIMDTVGIKATEAFTKGGRSEADKVLGFFETNVPGTNYKWGDTPYGSALRQQTIEKLDRMGNTKRVEETRLQKEADTKASNAAELAAVQHLADDPNREFPEEMLKAGEKYDPLFRVKVNTWRDSFRKERVAGNPEALRDLNWEIINGGGMAAVRKGVAKGILANKEDLVAAYKLAEGLDTAGADGQKFLGGSSVKAIEDSIRLRTSDENDVTKLLASGGFSDTGFQARLEFRMQMLDWFTRNPNASLWEQEKAVAEIGSAVLGRLGRESGGMGAATLAPANPGSPSQGPYKANAPAVQGPPIPEDYVAPQAPLQAQQQQAAPPARPGETPERLRADAEFYAQSNPEAARQFRERADALERQGASAQGGVSPEVQGWYNSLPPESQQLLRQRAQQTGTTPEALATEAYTRGVQAGSIKPAAPSAPPSQDPKAGMGKQVLDSVRPAPVAPGDSDPAAVLNPISFTTGSAESDAAINETLSRVSQAFANWQEGDAVPDEVVSQISSVFERVLGGTGRTSRTYSMAVLNDDPKAARILDFIAGPESGGNYNAYFRNANSKKDLSKMTFDEVVKWSRSRGTKSSATGRYQFMRDTLVGKDGKPGLKQELGLTGKELFTPELQDRMAIALLNRRGYQQWLNGKISTAKFANNLALEWASLPNITAQNGRRAGQSAYAGDGLNASLTTPAQVLKVLGGTDDA